MWCDVDVVEFSYYGAPAATPKEEFYTELVDGLRGSYPSIGSGSQVTLHLNPHGQYRVCFVLKCFLYYGHNKLYL